MKREGPERLLTLLRTQNGRKVTGTYLSQQLGISRTAVWKKVSQLRKLGYEIESIRSSGYRMISVPDKLLPEEIWNGLRTRYIGREIIYRENLDSTNQVATELARQGAGEGLMVVADSQTRGKGRLGRTWVSPAGCNLYFSILLRPQIIPVQIPQITLMASVSLAEFLSRAAELPVRIKWPNDLWLKGMKVGGILTEMAADMDRTNFVILGIGINVNMEKNAIPIELHKHATSLSLEGGRFFSRVDLLQGILSNLEKDYRLFCKQGFKPFQERWAASSMTLGQPVHVKLSRGELQGRAFQISGEGYLEVEKEDGSVETVVSGDVTVLKTEGRRMKAEGGT